MGFLAASDGTFSGPGLRARCALGRSGVIAAGAKREGDGASPIGAWPLRRVLYRPDRLAPPQTGLAAIALRPEDGWCDDPADPAYNRPVLRPYPASHEALWRDDHVYDVIVVLGHNDAPVVPGAGSAIFWHLAQPDYRPTEGCVAIALEDMLDALRSAAPGDVLEIKGQP